jgi:hypothetical protein
VQEVRQQRRRGTFIQIGAVIGLLLPSDRIIMRR